jgi:CRISPR system Cascade subunit CasE
MILSRLVLNPRSRDVIRDLGDCQQLHRTILSAFPQAPGPARAQFGVLFRIDLPRSGAPTLLVQSRQHPDWGRLPASYLAVTPEAKDVSGSYQSIAAGDILRFRLRANPTRRIDTKSKPDGTRRNGRRVELRTEEEKLQWLERKGLVHGFEVISVRSAGSVPNVRVNDEGKLHGYRSKPSAPLTHPLTLASVLFEGVLRVADAEAFRHALAEGIGPGKAYGFGLLSVASAQTP